MSEIQQKVTKHKMKQKNTTNNKKNRYRPPNYTDGRISRQGF